MKVSLTEELTAIVESVVGPACTPAEQLSLVNALKDEQVHDTISFVRAERKLRQKVKPTLRPEQFTHLISAFDFIHHEKGRFNTNKFRRFLLLRKRLPSKSQSSSTTTLSRTVDQNEDDDNGFFLDPQVFEPSLDASGDNDDDEEAVDDSVDDLQELKGFKVGRCYRYTLGEKACSLAIRSFTSDENFANCVLVVPVFETSLGQPYKCQDDDGEIKEFPGIEMVYGSKYVQVKKPLKPVPLDPTLLKPSLEPEEIPHVIFEPQQQGNWMEFAYYIDSRGRNRVGRRTNALSYIDMFCGAGGAHQGYKLHGISTLKAVDLNEAAVKTFKLNNPESADAAIYGDVYENLLLSKDTDNLSPTIAHSSSPCQGFSKKNHNPKETESDKKNNKLSFAFIDALKKWGCKLGIFENVPGMWSSKCMRYLRRILHELVAMEYQFRIMVLRDCDFGGPQKRPRLFIIALKSYILFPPRLEPTHVDPKLLSAGLVLNKLPWVTCKNVMELNDLAEPGTFSHQEERRKCNTKPGEQETFQLEPERLAPGVRATGAPLFHYKTYAETDEPRVTSVRDTAALQGFPNDYEFLGSMTEKYKQAGNAVSCRVIKALVGSLMPVLEFVYEEDYQEDLAFKLSKFASQILCD